MEHNACAMLCNVELCCADPEMGSRGGFTLQAETSGTAAPGDGGLEGGVRRRWAD